MTISKKVINAQVMESNSHVFRCPICSSGMVMVDKSQLVCLDNHSFDLSKNGYINLAPQAHVTKYDKTLFEARKTVMSSGFFNPVLEYITAIASEHLEGREQAFILDAGCGEGTHLSAILSQLPGDTIGAGIDLAKEGITAASKEYPGSIWSVADLANCPFQANQFDVILNILSPANYAEFTRLLKSDGLFIKAVPESGYLKELRAIFYEEGERKDDSDPVVRFKEHFDSVTTKRLTYLFPLAPALLAPLIRMTPLTWGASNEKIEEALGTAIENITIDFTIITGVKRVD